MSENIRDVFSKRITVHDGLVAGHALYAFSIPFSQRVNNIGLLLLICSCIVALISRKPGRPGLFLIITACLTAWLSVVAILSIHPLQEAVNDLQKFLPFFLFPLLMFMTAPFYKEVRIREAALWSFSIAVSLICLYCLVIGVYNFVTLEPSLDAANEDYFNRILSSWNYLSYERLSSPSGLHPAYLSLFISFVLFFLLSVNTTRRVKIPMIVMLSAFMVLLAARTGLLACAITFFIYVFTKRKQFGNSWKKYFFPGVAAAIILGGIFFANDVFRKRITDFATLETNVDVESWNALNLRLAIWNCNLSIGSKNMLTGIGFNDDIRNNCYEQFSFYPHYGTGFNAHNQFLEFFVVGGLGLFLLLMLYIAIPWRRAIKNLDSLPILFLILICINLMTECMLSRIKGLMFVCYFIALCYYSFPLKQENKRSI